MKKEQACGYILEVVLEKLLKVNGYEAITNTNYTSESGIELNNNILRVKGRGGNHQVDALGKFKITPPFMNPIRLFIEAKFYKNKSIGIEKIRMGIGILHDINTNYFTVSANKGLDLEVYEYRYALFSTSKFTEDAQLLALAHKICLIDLGSDRENGIKKIIEGYVSNIYKDIDSEYDKKYHNVQEERKEEYRSKKFQEIKNNFRSFEMTNNPDKSKYPEIEKLYKAVENKAIYIANIGCPQIITLLPEDNNMFKEALKKNPHQDISISYEKENEDYIIKPKSGEESEYCLSFRLQKVFSKALISELGGKNIPSKMSFIAYLDGKNPELCTLKFNKEEMIACIKEAKKRNSTK